MIDPPLHRGEFVHLTAAGRTVIAFVALASANGASLILMFEGLVGGYVGAMPVLLADDGAYRAIVDNLPVHLERAPEFGS